ncbi:MAG: ATP-binding cassette domain-containing protein [Nocardioidaceae bacterium]
MEGFHWVTDAHYAVVPKGVSVDKQAAIMMLLQYMLTPEQQAKAYDSGYFYPGPAIEGVELSQAPTESQDAIKEFGRPEYDQLIADNPTETPLDAESLVAAFDKWDRDIGGGKVARSGVKPSTERFQTLRLDGVSRRFGGQDALVGLDLTIEAGEFIALLGPSGCGKSTALNCVAGLLPLTGGMIWQDDTRIDTLPPERRGFGMVFQNYALFPHMSVRANVAFGLQMRKLPKEEQRRRTEEAIRLVDLDEHADKLPGHLSGGQQQRVAIARAVVLEPSLVLMDEPLSNLDAKLRLGMRTEIRRLHQSLGLTTVYVTHDQEEALSLADRLVVLRDGVVQQIGTPEELHAHPASWHVADFMGYRNLIRLRAGEAGAGREVSVQGHGLRLTGTAVGKVGEGTEVIAAVRPDDVEVLGAERAPGHRHWRRCRGRGRGVPGSRVRRRGAHRRRAAAARPHRTSARSRRRHQPAYRPEAVAGVPGRRQRGNERRRGQRSGATGDCRMTTLTERRPASGPPAPQRPSLRHRLAERGVDRHAVAAAAGSGLRPGVVPLPVLLRACSCRSSPPGADRSPTTSGSSPTPTSETPSGSPCGSHCLPQYSTSWRRCRSRTGCADGSAASAP